MNAPPCTTAHTSFIGVTTAGWVFEPRTEAFTLIFFPLFPHSSSILFTMDDEKFWEELQHSITVHRRFYDLLTADSSGMAWPRVLDYLSSSPPAPWSPALTRSSSPEPGPSSGRAISRPLAPVLPIPVRNRRNIPKLVCHFCKRNNEQASVYTSHVCKDKSGIVICPVLRNLRCDICQYPGGDHAHTRRHCPENPDKCASRGPPMPVVLRSGFNSVGRPYTMSR